MYLNIVLNIYCVLFIQSSYFIILFRDNNGNVRKGCWGEHGSILESIYRDKNGNVRKGCGGEHGSILESIYCIEIIMAMLGKAV